MPRDIIDDILVDPTLTPREKLDMALDREHCFDSYRLSIYAMLAEGTMNQETADQLLISIPDGD